MRARGRERNRPGRRHNDKVFGRRKIRHPVLSQIVSGGRGALADELTETTEKLVPDSQHGKSL